MAGEFRLLSIMKLIKVSQAFSRMESGQLLKID